MRLSYVEKDAKFSSAEDQAIVERVKQRRGDAGLFKLDRALLHAPPVADGWNSFLGAVRTSTSLSTSIRETAICRVAVLNQAWYEWDHHAPLLLAAPGITPEHVDVVLRSATHQLVRELQDEKHAAVMAYADAMTVNVSISDDVFARVKASFTEKEIVEITATIAAYNCVSRFLVALDVGEKNAQNGPGDH